MPIERQQPYKAIRAKTINAGVEAREMLDKLEVAAPLELSRGPGGLLLRLAATIPQNATATASGTITARSGSTFGKGSAVLEFLQLNASGDVEVVSLAEPVTVDVFNRYPVEIADGAQLNLMTINGLWMVAQEACTT